MGERPNQTRLDQVPLPGRPVREVSPGRVSWEDILKTILKFIAVELRRSTIKHDLAFSAYSSAWSSVTMFVCVWTVSEM
ncbi:hypothetical protein JTE90_006574 [Oedothorax gibbosus]|uniref:Uncharacterized protein n=1 Tax=Oedothorax gibbosus TaxID=931172 RepID=A0AAV6VIV3_9ARAC|nr:hypothetical protein JTE90_006574 [Oedothorax gibbosus]